MEMKSKGSLGIVFISGAGLDGWIWEKLAEKLPYPCLAIDLPGRGRHSKIGTKNLSLIDYIELAASQIKNFGTERIIVVSHSIGTVLALELSGRMTSRVSGLIVISSNIPKAKQSYISTMPFPTRFLLPLLLRLASTRPPESAIRDGLCQDLTPEDASRVVNGFVSESSRLYTDKLRNPRLPEKRLYIETTNDKTFSIELQRKASKVFGDLNVVSVNAGHLPMLSKTEELSKIIKSFAEAVPEN